MKFGSVRSSVVFIVLAAICAFAFAFAVQPAGAQTAQVAQAAPAAPSNPGTLRGTVTDPSGAAVSQAAVVMMSASGQFTTGKTNATGAYEIKGLAAGSYTLTVNADGFAVFEQDNVQIAPGQVQTVNELAVGHPVDPRRGVDPGDPQTTEVTFAVFTVAIAVLVGLEHRLLGGPVVTAGVTTHALRHRQRGAALLTRVY